MAQPLRFKTAAGRTTSDHLAQRPGHRIRQCGMRRRVEMHPVHRADRNHLARIQKRRAIIRGQGPLQRRQGPRPCGPAKEFRLDRPYLFHRRGADQQHLETCLLYTSRCV